jgi:two-component system, NtrC family, sensor kinase
MNILANAIDAIDEQSVKKNREKIEKKSSQITIWTSLVNQFIEIAIADNGCGISESIQSQIFNKLSRNVRKVNQHLIPFTAIL